ncbi:MAG: arrestin family protein [archaeon]|nr:arrestin family protein [archaeon]
MVFGFGAGKIDLKLEKTVFNPGETIQGEVFLKVNKPTKAKGVKVVLRATMETTSYSHGKRTNRTETLYNFEQEMDVEREYDPSDGERTYKFQLQVPTNIGNKPDFGNEALGQLMNVANMFSGRSSQVKWLLTAKLDIPMGFDVSKTVQISVSESK